MKKSILLLAISLIFIGSCKKEETNTPPKPIGSTLTLKSITPNAGSTLNGTEMMSAVLEYNIGDDYDATELYQIDFMLKNTSGGWEFGGNDINFIELTAKSGTVTLEYDFADLWSDPDYMHPFTLRFSIIKRQDTTPPWSWSVLTDSEEVVYAN